MKNIRVVTDVAESFCLFTINARSAATCLLDVRTNLCSSRLFMSLLTLCIVLWFRLKTEYLFIYLLINCYRRRRSLFQQFPQKHEIYREQCVCTLKWILKKSCTRKNIYSCSRFFYRLLFLLQPSDRYSAFPARLWDLVFSLMY